MGENLINIYQIVSLYDTIWKISSLRGAEKGLRTPAPGRYSVIVVCNLLAWPISLLNLAKSCRYLGSTEKVE